MDPNNAVVKLCVDGMRCEADGRLEDAAALFQQAWERSQDDFERCIAAHYVARAQKTPSDALRWNEEALQRANAIAGERVSGFYSSLYLNLGKSYEDLGNSAEAQRFYSLAREWSGVLPNGRYRRIVEDGVERRLASEPSPTSPMRGPGAGR